MNLYFGKCRKLSEHGIHREKYITLTAHKFSKKIIPLLLNRVLYDCFNLIYAYLNKGDKVFECYSCLKMVIEANLHVGFFTRFFIKRGSLKLFYLYLKLLQSSTVLYAKK